MFVETRPRPKQVRKVSGRVNRSGWAPGQTGDANERSAPSRQVTGPLLALGAAVAVGDLWLIATCWSHRAVLGGVLGAAGIALVAFAIASGPTSPGGKGALLIAAALLIIGAGLYRLGQALERLLDEGPDEEI